MMEQLFKCKTVQQRKIMEWLVDQGITGKDITAAEMLDYNKVEITNPAGQYMVLICDDMYRVGIDNETELRLTANKGKIMALARAKGFDPPRGAEFTKAYRRCTWWLEWFDASGSHKATLSTAAGKAFFGMRCRENLDGPEKWSSCTLSMKELQQFDLLEVVHNPERPDYEPEM